MAKKKKEVSMEEVRNQFETLLDDVAMTFDRLIERIDDLEGTVEELEAELEALEEALEKMEAGDDEDDESN